MCGGSGGERGLPQLISPRAGSEGPRLSLKWAALRRVPGPLPEWLTVAHYLRLTVNASPT